VCCPIDLFDRTFIGRLLNLYEYILSRQPLIGLILGRAPAESLGSCFFPVAGRFKREKKWSSLTSSRWQSETQGQKSHGKSKKPRPHLFVPWAFIEDFHVVLRLCANDHTDPTICVINVSCRLSLIDRFVVGSVDRPWEILEGLNLRTWWTTISLLTLLASLAPRAEETMQTNCTGGQGRANEGLGAQGNQEHA
jgi:hypothetical protein